MSSLLNSLTGIACEPGGPAFAAPWQAQAFAMTLFLHERGAFTWSEWAAVLGEQIEAARHGGDPDLGDTYYHHWLKALETLVAAKGLVSSSELARYASAWGRAAERTPHGVPIILEERDLQSERN
ncbi:MAG TPA: nitrile hydratase accessory protein [Steroidobacteraceae bacterium]|nr:nitrile hydratase accessory protein [Steroidobacteraceae bacterium]